MSMKPDETLEDGDYCVIAGGQKDKIAVLVLEKKRDHPTILTASNIITVLLDMRFISKSSSATTRDAIRATVLSNQGWKTIVLQVE
jgi:hypothetical protein